MHENEHTSALNGKMSSEVSELIAVLRESRVGAVRPRPGFSHEPPGGVGSSPGTRAPPWPLDV